MLPLRTWRYEAGRPEQLVTVEAAVAADPTHRHRFEPVTWRVCDPIAESQRMRDSIPDDCDLAPEAVAGFDEYLPRLTSPAAMGPAEEEFWEVQDA